MVSFRQISGRIDDMLELTGFVYCPRCGGSTVEAHRKKAMRCTKCEYVYFHNTGAAVAGVIEITEGVILTVRAHEPKAGMFDLPGGFVDYGESMEGALMREIREELGLDVVIESYLGSFSNSYFYRDVAYFTADSFFVCRPAAAGARIAGGEEISSWGIFPLDALPLDRMGFESNVKALESYRSRKASR